MTVKLMSKSQQWISYVRKEILVNRTARAESSRAFPQGLVLHQAVAFFQHCSIFLELHVDSNGATPGSKQVRQEPVSTRGYIR